MHLSERALESVYNDSPDPECYRRFSDWANDLARRGLEIRLNGGEVPPWEDRHRSMQLCEVGVWWQWDLYRQIAEEALYGGEDIRDVLGACVWTGYAWWLRVERGQFLMGRTWAVQTATK